MSRYALYAESGPLEGQFFKLDQNTPLIIGRTPRGLNMPDPQVSMRHAEVSWSGDSFWISDLGSATGTVVNGRRVGREPLALRPGMRVEIGESVLVLRLRQTLPTWMLWFLGLFLIVFGPLSVYALFTTYSSFARDAPGIWFGEDMVLRTPCGDVNRLALNQCFMQETNNTGEIYRTRLRDLDGDGTDELWLVYPNGERIYTFGDCMEDGQPQWLLVADLPKECVPQDSRGFPELKCPGNTSYRYMPGNAGVRNDGTCSDWSPLGRYRGGVQLGVTAWMRGNEETGGALKPYQFTQYKEDTLAGFLEARGIHEPIHFLVCEDFLPGLAPQVLTQSGTIQPLQWGCIRELSLGGSARDRWFGAELPRAMAFTSAGRQALIEQSAIFLSGTPDRGFMSWEGEELWNAIKQGPDARGSILLSFHSPQPGMFWPIPDPEDDVEVTGRLTSARLSTDTLPPLGSTWAGSERPGPLRARCGCSILSVIMGDSVLTGTPNPFGKQPFMTITEAGEDCDSNADPPLPWTVPYSTGTYAFRHDNMEVEVNLTMTAGDQIAQVISQSISYRTPYHCGAHDQEEFPIRATIEEP